jgi:hypothetical protein
MITTSAVLNAAASAITGNTAINTWITTNVGVSAVLKIFVGDDPQNPAGEADAPFCVLSPAIVPYDLGDGTDARQPSIDVDFGLVNADTSTSGNVTTYEGLADIDALAHLILAALSAEFGNGNLETANYTITPTHPLYEAGFTVVFRFIGGAGEAALP